MFVVFFKKIYDWFNAKWINGKVHVTSVTHNCNLASNVRVSKHSYCYNTEIGAYSYLSGFNLVGNTKIGKFCSIGLFVSIGPGQHPTNTFVSTSPAFYSLNKPTFSSRQAYNETSKVEIGNDVWIGSNAVILDGVRIGHGAIIAAGSVVNKDVEPYTIVGGVPAKPIRKRFSDEIISQLIDSKWWDKSDEWLKRNCENMQNVEIFLAAITEDH
jgi:acetyltransferase-like isoleucine patch superfamily enzyme